MAETGAIAAPELAEHAKRLLSSNLFNNSPESTNVLGLADGKQQQNDKENQAVNEETPDDQTTVSREEIEDPDINE